MSENNESPIKQERVKRALWRYSEDGTYNNKPTSETYFRDYYREKIAGKVTCELCGRIVGKQKLDRRTNTKICAKYSAAKLLLNCIKYSESSTSSESSKSYESDNF